MANEIQLHHHAATGRNLYVVIVNDDPDSADYGKWWNATGGAWEAMVVANWAQYAVALAESPAGGYRYVGTFPAAIGLGWHLVITLDRAGGAAAISDTVVASLSMHWDAARLRLESKGLSQSLAILAGKQVHVPATGVATNYHRDGTTVAATQTLTGGGNRNAPTLP
jgi:hypothetical protein